MAVADLPPEDPSLHRSGLFSTFRLDSRRLDVKVLAAGIAYQILLRFLTFRLEFDDVCEIAAGQCFVNGGPIGARVLSASDLSVAHRSALSHWPPAYSLLIAFLLKLTRSLYAAAVAAELLGLAVLGIGTFLILNRLRDVISPAGRLLVALVVGWWGPPYLAVYHTNLWALALFFCAVGLLLPPQGLKDAHPRSWFAAGFLLGITVALRYAYAPLSLVPIGVTLLLSLSHPSFWKRASVLIAGWAVVIASMAWWKIVYVGSSHFGRGGYSGVLYFASFAKFYPFAADALFGPRLTALFPKSSYLYSRAVDPFQFGLRHILSLIILAGATGGAVWSVRSARTRAASKTAMLFFSISLATLVVDVSFLSYMALVSKPWDTAGRWVYVSEARYFSVCFLFILFGAAAAATATRDFNSTLAKVGCQLAFAGAGLAFLASLPAQGKALRAWRIGGPFERYLYDGGAFVRVVRRAMPGDNPLVTVEISDDRTSGNFRRTQAMLLNVPGALIRPGQTVATSRPVRVLFVADPKKGDDIWPAFNDLCQRAGGKPFVDNGLDYCEASLFPSTPQAALPHI